MKNNLKSTSRILTGAIATVLLTGPFGVSFAQDSDDEAESGQSLTLEKITVNARKRAESLQDTPVIISALSEKTLSDFGIESVEDVADFTPGLVSDSQGNSAGGILFLRGVGSGSGSPSIDQAVSLVIDDMQVGSLQIQYSALIDMESVQVYKGPQALFFGKNSPGGVLSIQTADPGDEFEAQLKAGYEFNANEWFTQGIVSGPISDTVAGRLVMRYSETDGLFDVNSGGLPSNFGDTAPEDQSFFARGTLVFDPTDNLTIRTKLTYSDKDANVDGRAQIQRVLCPFGDPQGSPTFVCEANSDIQILNLPQGAIDAFDGLGFPVEDPTGDWQNEQILATVGIDYNLTESLTLSSVTGYYDISDFQTGATSFALIEAFVASVQQIEFNQFSQELRLASDFDGPLNFVTGAYYEQKEHDTATPALINFGLVGGLGFDLWVPLAVTEYVQDTEAMSAFIDLSWDITENLELSGGIRASYEEKKFAGGDPATATSGYIGNAEEEWDDVSPQVTVSYRASDEWMLFGSYREGFKSGGFDGAFSVAPVAPRTFEPETVEGFEVGAKGTLLDNTLQLNLAAFSYKYDDLQLSRFDPTTNSLFTFNAAGADIEGLEADFVWVTPVEGLLARGALAFLDASFSDYAAPCYTGQSIAAGCNGDPVAGVFNTQDLTGEPLNLAAEQVVNLGLSYEKPLGGVILDLSMDAIYSSEYETSSDRTPGTGQDAFTKLDAAIGLSSPNDTWSLSLIGRNLTDEYTITNGGTSPGTGALTGTAGAVRGDSIAYVRPGRTVAVELAYDF